MPALNRRIGNRLALRSCRAAGVKCRPRSARKELVLSQSDTGVLDEIVRRIVEIAHPERIILFGSAARGQSGPSSDVDLLVVVSPGTHRRRLTMDIYRGLSDLGCPVDAVVVTSEDVERYGACPALVIEPALREGREVYHG